MEQQFKLQYNGQQVIQDDLNLLGETSALADDRVFAELFRMAPFDGTTVRRGILPAGYSGSHSLALVAPNGASASVVVNPFRSFVGSRATAAVGPVANWRDIRSTLAVGTTGLAQTKSFAPNSSGNPRWDLVYAAVSVDADTATVERKVKDPDTSAITATNVVTRIATTVALGVVQGTAAASPNQPAPPADASGTYYIPLAYVRIPNGFNATSTVLASDIATVAPCISLSRTTGASTLSIPDCAYNLTAAQIQAWGATGTRPARFMPSTLQGAESLFVYLDLTNASSANWSHASTSVIDSRNWRRRFTKWMATTSNGSGLPNWWNGTASNVVREGFGNSLSFSGGRAGVAGVTSDDIDMATGSDVSLYVDDADGGKLKLGVSTTPPLRALFFWIEFSAPFDNAF